MAISPLAVPRARQGAWQTAPVPLRTSIWITELCGAPSGLGHSRGGSASMILESCSCKGTNCLPLTKHRNASGSVR